MSAAGPAVVAYLVNTTFPTALASYTDDEGNGATIYFGPGVLKFTTAVTVQIYGVTFELDWAEVGPNYRYEEKGTVPCTLTSWVPGQADSSAFLDRLTECANALSDISVNVANDVRLGGLVRWTRLRASQINPIHATGANGSITGSMCHVNFDLSYTVRVDSLDATGQDP